MGRSNSQASFACRAARCSSSDPAISTTVQAMGVNGPAMRATGSRTIIISGR